MTRLIAFIAVVFCFSPIQAGWPLICKVSFASATEVLVLQELKKSTTAKTGINSLIWYDLIIKSNKVCGIKAQKATTYLNEKAQLSIHRG